MQNDEMTKAIYIIHKVSGCPLEELRLLGMNQLQTLSDAISPLFDIETPKEVFKTFEFNGKKYGMIPDFSSMTVGEFADLDTMTKQDLVANIHKIMAILYRPLKYAQNIMGEFVWDVEEYTAEQHKLQSMEFKKLPYSYFLQVSRFFFLLSTTYTTDILKSLEIKGIENNQENLNKLMSLKQRLALVKNLDGWQS
jgi:hypothetical protein